MFQIPSRSPRGSRRRSPPTWHWANPGAVASVPPTPRPLPQVAVDPPVASLPRDAVELAQLGDRKRVAKVIGDELRPLVHRGRLLPRHGHLLGALPGCPVSPMSLD